MTWESEIVEWTARDGYDAYTRLRFNERWTVRRNCKGWRYRGKVNEIKLVTRRFYLRSNAKTHENKWLSIK
jgi:hypothetical protein